MPVRLRPSAGIGFMQGSSYLPIAVFAVVAIAVGIIPLCLAKLMSVSKPSVAKKAPFECGFPAMDEARMPFDIQYYLVAILFILFDIETAFLFPWAIVVEELSLEGFLAMFFFLFLLLVGFIFEWKKGALDWQ